MAADGSMAPRTTSWTGIRFMLAEVSERKRDRETSQMFKCAHIAEILHIHISCSIPSTLDLLCYGYVLSFALYFHSLGYLFVFYFHSLGHVWHTHHRPL